MMVGEGAGIVILERYEDAMMRRAPILAEILGYGMTCDAKHMTIPDVNGINGVMKSALRDAELCAQDIDYINAHGTGTPANDRTECAAIRRTFNTHADEVLVSSTKSMIGHTMGAASALEAIVCVLAIRMGVIPPTINYETPDPECDVDCVPNKARSVSVNYALNNAFAFGGNNAAVVFGRCSAGQSQRLNGDH